MLNIAVCDDDQVCLRDIGKLLSEYERYSGIELTVSVFSNPFDLGERLEKGVEFKLFLLDIYMPGITGITLAQELRCRGINAPIVFLTASHDHALEAFGVGATQYLLKPLDKTAFFTAMDVATEKSMAERRRQIILKMNDGYRAIAVRDILCVEAQNNNQVIRLTDGSALTVRMTSTELYAILSQYTDFVRCGVAYILNLAHIRSLNTKSVLLKDGTSIKIPRGAYPELKSSYFQFFYERRE